MSRPHGHIEDTQGLILLQCGKFSLPMGQRRTHERFNRSGVEQSMKDMVAFCMVTVMPVNVVDKEIMLALLRLVNVYATQVRHRKGNAFQPMA